MQVFVENLYSILKFFLHFKPFYCETFWGHSWWVTWCWLWLHGTYLEELFCWKFMGGKPVISGSATRTTTPNENRNSELRFSLRTYFIKQGCGSQREPQIGFHWNCLKSCGSRLKPICGSRWEPILLNSPQIKPFGCISARDRLGLIEDAYVLQAVIDWDDLWF